MDKLKILELVGKAFAYGDVETLSEYMHANCRYSSDYAKKHLLSKEEILRSMKQVYENIREYKDGDASYSYEIVKLEDILADGVRIIDLREESLFPVYEYGLKLFQFSRTEPASIAYVKFSPADALCEICLSRSTRLFNVSFFEDNDLKDSEKDLPYTVRPMTSHDVHIRELQRYFISQRQEYENVDDSEVYIWRQADRFFKENIGFYGYTLIESFVYDDCIGYRCHRNNRIFTFYMFARGQGEFFHITGEFCATLAKREFSQGMVLVVCLSVERRQIKDGKFSYNVGNHITPDDIHMKFWHPRKIGDKNVLLYFHSDEMIEMTHRLAYAFNNDNLDVFDYILSNESFSFKSVEASGQFYHAGAFSCLNRIHAEHGDMKIGFISYDNKIFSMVPYIIGYGWFDFNADNGWKITSIKAHALDECDGCLFVAADEPVDSKVMREIPSISKIETMEPVLSERFSIKLYFTNGEIRKYVLPISLEESLKEVVRYDHHAFSEGIWKSAKIEDNPVPRYKGFVLSKPGIIFKNGYMISGTKAYTEARAYSEPVMAEEIIFENEAILLRKKWEWAVNLLSIDEEKKGLKALIDGRAYNYKGFSTLATIDGKRKTPIDFSYISDGNEDLYEVAVANGGFGFIDNDAHFIFPPEYKEAKEFYGGYAWAKKGDDWYILKRNGESKRCWFRNEYQDVAEFSEGLCRVSTLKLSSGDLAYHSDFAEIAGTWGYVDENGREVIKPQYIYAEDFDGGVAIVCKGKWTRDPKWDNKYNKGRFWTDEELWGGIDKNGNEVIPFVFDEIGSFNGSEGAYRAHYGGWENGHWGVIDREGKWLAEPVFDDIDYDYYDGMFAFYGGPKWDDEALLGIYDCRQKRAIFNPQFKDVFFMEDGGIRIERYDESLGRDVEEIIDREGNARFKSDYTSISCYLRGPVWKVEKNVGDKRYAGLIDHEGNVVLPCEYEPNGLNFCSISAGVLDIKGENGKVGIIDFNGKTILPTIYESISGYGEPYYRVKKDNLVGLVKKDGTVLIPPTYKNIQIYDANQIIIEDMDKYIMAVIEEKD